MCVIHYDGSSLETPAVYPSHLAQQKGHGLQSSPHLCPSTDILWGSNVAAMPTVMHCGLLHDIPALYCADTANLHPLGMVRHAIPRSAMLLSKVLVTLEMLW